jgi:hypothetical protein
MLSGILTPQIMKNTSTIFSLIVALTITSVAMEANAQGNSQRRDDGRSDHRSRKHNKKDKKKNYSYHDDQSNRRNERRVVEHVHYHDRYCNHRPVVVHHHAARPRYIYYRDYDVYYDSHKSVYISLSGRNWTVTSSIPIGMRHVNVRTVKRYEVDYYDDDFPNYLQRRRPAYGREYTGW